LTIHGILSASSDTRLNELLSNVRIGGHDQTAFLAAIVLRYCARGREKVEIAIVDRGKLPVSIAARRRIYHDRLKIAPSTQMTGGELRPLFIEDSLKNVVEWLLHEIVPAKTIRAYEIKSAISPA
jgi:hypothetical protein